MTETFFLSFFLFWYPTKDQKIIPPTLKLSLLPPTLKNNKSGESVI